MAGSGGLLVTIAMPALNEERYIAAAIATLMPEEPVGFECELLVADGGSSDATAKIVRMLARGDPSIRLLNNEKRVQAAGINLAARHADPRSAILVRADCHAVYPSGFVASCVEALQKTGAASVVVPMHTKGTSCMQRAVAAAQNSRLGNGGSAHRLAGQTSRYVDHGHHAAFDRRRFLAMGGYDESFRVNEDAEYDQRLSRSGGRIWLESAAGITYFPRADLLSLGRQYAAYGSGRARTSMARGMSIKPRQLLPVVAFLVCGLSTGLAMIDLRFLLADAVYALVCVLWGLALAARARSPCLALAGVAAVTMHLAWGYGFVKVGVLALAGGKMFQTGSDGGDPAADAGHD